ncbi:longitudinals lacking protein, isoforms H/M/V-like isoform X2 [Adelges cooleyi]|uniref:longitudinals lacking protein, isoforms H/M/V-like isoform X2 n=1 Tax=Adelges cooleyi TaxID=133065 RepID=UPI00217F60B0|nr:longitudinals lacking protein, isoforms H/M/V-like isoform X2 [Adelges cooleyi]
MADQRFCLRWNNHQPNLVNVMTGLLNSEMFVDATIAAEGRKIQVHKVVLSACSSYFQMLFNETPCQHPIIIIKDMSYNHLKILIEFMYYGEVNISQDQLPVILKAAESLQIKGLAEKSNLLATPQPMETEYSLLSPSAKRKKMHMRTSSDKSDNNSSMEDNSVKTEQNNLAISSQPVLHGQETSKLIHSSAGGVPKHSSSENINQKPPEGWSFLEQLPDCPPHSIYAIPKAKTPYKQENKIRKKREPGIRDSDRFKEALEAVRAGRMGFCRAAQEYGINNRTLWLEYKKKGYPVHRKGQSSSSSIQTTAPSPVSINGQSSEHVYQAPLYEPSTSTQTTTVDHPAYISQMYTQPLTVINPCYYSSPAPSIFPAENHT